LQEFRSCRISEASWWFAVQRSAFGIRRAQHSALPGKASRLTLEFGHLETATWPEAELAVGLSPGFQPHERDDNCETLRWAMAFVPEGQADRSQARSAWVAMQRGPVPEGRSKPLSVPQKFVVETELMPLQKRQALLLKSSGPKMFELILDGTNGFRQLRDAHTESPNIGARSLVLKIQ
jgi:hypothetical protein